MACTAPKRGSLFATGGRGGTRVGGTRVGVGEAGGRVAVGVGVAPPVCAPTGTPPSSSPASVTSAAIVFNRAPCIPTPSRDGSASAGSTGAPHRARAAGLTVQEDHNNARSGPPKELPPILTGASPRHQAPENRAPRAGPSARIA